MIKVHRTFHFRHSQTELQRSPEAAADLIPNISRLRAARLSSVFTCFQSQLFSAAAEIKRED